MTSRTPAELAREVREASYRLCLATEQKDRRIADEAGAALLAALAELQAQAEAGQRLCPLCGHEWRRHDPEDGKCDAPSEEGIGACECGHMFWTRERIAMLSRDAFAAAAPSPADQEEA